MIDYDENYRRIVEDGVNGIKEIFCSKDTYQIKKFFFALIFI